MSVSRRDRLVIDDYVNRRLSVKDIGSKHTITTRQVYNILRKHKVKLSSKKRDNTQPKSDLHVRIGKNVEFYRKLHYQTQTSMAKAVNMSERRLKAIEEGLFDVSIMDLQKLCKFFKINFEEIVK